MWHPGTMPEALANLINAPGTSLRNLGADAEIFMPFAEAATQVTCQGVCIGVRWG